MAYIIIITILTVLFGLRVFSCIILREDKSQFLMVFVYIVYIMFTFDHRFMGGSIHAAGVFTLVSYFLLTLTYILIGEYIRSIYPNKIYKYISFGLYAVLISLMINQYVFYYISECRSIFTIGMCELSVVYVCISVIFLITDWKRLNWDVHLMMLVTNVMILCLVMILIFNMMDAAKDVYWFAFGILLYVIAAEYVSIKKITMRLSELNDISKQVESGIVMQKNAPMITQSSEQIESQHTQVETKEFNKTEYSEWRGKIKFVFELMLNHEEYSAKDIAIATHLATNTVKVYMNQIYSRLGVHSRDEFYQKIKHHHSVE